MTYNDYLNDPVAEGDPAYAIMPRYDLVDNQFFVVTGFDCFLTFTLFLMKLLKLTFFFIR